MATLAGYGVGSSIGPAGAQGSCPTRSYLGDDTSQDIEGVSGYADTLQSEGGADFIRGYDCNDSLHGGPGTAPDHARGATGHDDVYGGGGGENSNHYVPYADNQQGELEGGGDNDDVEGGEGNDDIYDSTTGDSDNLFGQGGDDDYVWGWDDDGADDVRGGQGNSDSCFVNQYDARSDCEFIY